jgi:two-component system response regulator AtoC
MNYHIQQRGMINLSHQAYQLLPFASLFPPDAVIFGESKAMHEVRARIYRIAYTNVPVLISGESGTGKDVIAGTIHNLSPWRNGPFVKVSCSAIPSTLLESELFGYQGAHGIKPGRVEMAYGGTLFLGEVSQLDLTLQSRLLQLLQDGPLFRVGAREKKGAKLRIVCATNRQLGREVEKGSFRRDLYHRLNLVNLRLPLLRERQGDLVTLVEYFLDYYNRKYNCQTRMLTPNLMAHLQKYHWPGNIRELENLIKRYVVMGNEDAIRKDLLARSEQEWGAPEINLDEPISLKDLTRKATRELESKVILKVLEAHRWNRKRAAQALSISYRSLLYKIEEVGLSPSNSGCREKKAS